MAASTSISAQHAATDVLGFSIPERAPQILPSGLVHQRLDIRIVPGPDTAPPGTFPEYDSAWQACADGDPVACNLLDDDLAGPLVDSGAYRMFGGGRRRRHSPGSA